MAVGDRSMAAYRPGQKRSRLFARLNPNFASGRYTPPSKNLAQQPRLFRSSDPYAGGSQVMQAMQQRLARSRSAQPMGGVAGPSMGGVTGQPVGAAPGPSMGGTAMPILTGAPGSGAYGGVGGQPTQPAIPHTVDSLRGL